MGRPGLLRCRGGDRDTERAETRPVSGSAPPPPAHVRNVKHKHEALTPKMMLVVQLLAGSDALFLSLVC